MTTIIIFFPQGEEDNNEDGTMVRNNEGTMKGDSTDG